MTFFVCTWAYALQEKEEFLMKKKNLLIIFAVIVFALNMTAFYLIFSPKAVLGAKDIRLIVNHLNSEPAEYEIRTREKYLRGALEYANLVKGHETSYGLWVETVDGESADESNQEWWGYRVNGKFAEYGVDSQIISDGDIYEFTLNVGY